MNCQIYSIDDFNGNLIETVAKLNANADHLKYLIIDINNKLCTFT